MSIHFETPTAYMHRSALRAKTYCDVDFNQETKMIDRAFRGRFSHNLFR